MCILLTFLCQETKEGLKGKPDWSLQVDILAVCQIDAARGVPTTSFQIT